MNRKKTLILILAVSGLVTLGAFLYYFSGNDPANLIQNDIDIAENKNSPSNSIDVGEEKVEELFSLDMGEEAVQIALHHMSHQKVIADKKWGALQITPDRIQRLIEVVEHNSQEYKYSGIYLRILNRWADGDFSQADRDHNAIWELQGGTIGKATGLLNAKEEEKYIRKHFK